MREVPKNMSMLVQHWDEWIRGGFTSQLRNMNIFSEESVDDCVQQFYMSILESSRRGSDWFTRYHQPPGKGPEAGFKAWLGMCIRNAAVNYYRVQRRANSKSVYIETIAPATDEQPGTVRVEDHEELQQVASQDGESETENLMAHLWDKMSDEGEMTMLVCALFYKGKSPTEVAEFLAAKRAEEQGIKYAELDEAERTRRLSQCKPIVSQYRARIQDKAVELNLLSLKSVERLIANHFGVENVKPYTKVWQYILYFCRKYGVATVGRFVERYANTPEEKTEMERRIRRTISRWQQWAPPGVAQLERTLFSKKKAAPSPTKGEDNWTQAQPLMQDAVQDHRLF